MVKTPYIGQLDRKIKIVNITETKDTTGAVKSVDTVFCEPFSMLDDLSGSEAIDGKVMHLINRKYTIRYRKEIFKSGTKMDLIDSNQRFSINHVKLLGRKKYLELFCSLYE